MPTKKIVRHICDECGKEEVSEQVPAGWVRVLSSRGWQSREGGRVNSPAHHGPPAYLWTPTRLFELPEDGYWCSKGCIMAFLESAVDQLLETAKLGRR